MAAPVRPQTRLDYEPVTSADDKTWSRLGLFTLVTSAAAVALFIACVVVLNLSGGPATIVYGRLIPILCISSAVCALLAGTFQHRIDWFAVLALSLALLTLLACLFWV